MLYIYIYIYVSLSLSLSIYIYTHTYVYVYIYIYICSEVIGMLEVIEGDFQRTVSETEAAEKQAAQDRFRFVTKLEL